MRNRTPSRRWLRAPAALNHRPASTDELDEQDHERDHEQNVDEPSQGVGADDSKQPKNQQDYKDSPEHRSPRFQLRISGHNSRLDALCVGEVARTQCGG
jgi:hypothetical protein